MRPRSLQERSKEEASRADGERGSPATRALCHCQRAFSRPRFPALPLFPAFLSFLSVIPRFFSCHHDHLHASSGAFAWQGMSRQHFAALSLPAQEDGQTREPGRSGCRAGWNTKLAKARTVGFNNDNMFSFVRICLLSILRNLRVCCVSGCGKVEREFCGWQAPSWGILPRVNTPFFRRCDPLSARGGLPGIFADRSAKLIENGFVASGLH